MKGKLRISGLITRLQHFQSICGDLVVVVTTKKGRGIQQQYIPWEGIIPVIGVGEGHIVILPDCSFRKQKHGK